MRNLIGFFTIISSIFLISCSFDKKTGVWKEHNKKIIEKSKKNQTADKIFSKKKLFDEEIDSQEIIIVEKKQKNLSWLENNLNLRNSVPHLHYENKKNIITKSKKIGKTTHIVDSPQKEPLILDENIFFNDLNGNIYKYSTDRRKLLWKFNFYKKKFKNIPIKINLKILSNDLIVSDSLGYFYNVDLETGKLNWAKNQGVPLTSEVKSYDGKIFLLNQDNKFYVFNETDGKKIIDFETFPVVLKKNIMQSIGLDNNNLYFVTSAGQIFSLNHLDFRINWLKNIKDADTSDEYGLFYSSPVVVKDKYIYLSSSKTTMSIDTDVGKTNWEISFGTKIKPIISNKFIFLISEDGFILNADRENGKIIWSRKLFKSKDVNLNKMGEVTSLLLVSDQLFFTTKNGYFFFLNYKNGEIINFARVAKSFYSKPSVANGKIYIIDKSMRVLEFN